MGKKMPMLSFWNEHGGITPTILTDCLRYMDQQKLYSREDGRIPFILLDAHSSRFSLEFLRYINDDAHKWCVCIGVPYGTHLWQVADSEEQNGNFTIEFCEAKRVLLKKKWDTGTGRDLNRYDIVPCINKAFEKSFRNVTTNLKAINQRGWGINLNRALLDNTSLVQKMCDTDREREKNAPWGRPDLLHASPSNTECIHPGETTTPPAAPSELNLNNGIAARYMDDILKARDSDKQRSDLKRRKKKHENIWEAYLDLKKKFRLTGGTAVVNGCYELGPHCHDIMEDKELLVNFDFLKKKVSAYMTFRKTREECRKALALNLPSDRMDATQCCDVVRFLKSKKKNGKCLVEKMPMKKNLKEARRMCTVVRGRPEPSGLPCTTEREWDVFNESLIGSADCHDDIGVAIDDDGEHARTADNDGMGVDVDEDHSTSTDGATDDVVAALLML